MGAKKGEWGIWGTNLHTKYLLVAGQNNYGCKCTHCIAISLVPLHIQYKGAILKNWLHTYLLAIQFCTKYVVSSTK